MFSGEVMSSGCRPARARGSRTRPASSAFRRPCRPRWRTAAAHEGERLDRDEHDQDPDRDRTLDLEDVHAGILGDRASGPGRRDPRTEDPGSRRGCPEEGPWISRRSSRRRPSRPRRSRRRSSRPRSWWPSRCCAGRSCASWRWRSPSWRWTSTPWWPGSWWSWPWRRWSRRTSGVLRRLLAADPAHEGLAALDQVAVGALERRDVVVDQVLHPRRHGAHLALERVDALGHDGDSGVAERLGLEVEGLHVLLHVDAVAGGRGSARRRRSRATTSTARSVTPTPA